MKRLAYFFLAAAIICCADVGRAEDLTSAGRVFAEKVCAACHVVAEDQRFAPILKPPAPSFLDIARRPNLSEASLRQFLRAPHGAKGKNSKMPNAMLAQYQIDEVVAYLLSLKGGS